MSDPQNEQARRAAECPISSPQPAPSLSVERAKDDAWTALAEWCEAGGIDGEEQADAYTKADAAIDALITAVRAEAQPEHETTLARLDQPQLRASESDLRDGEWRPIETAPKDGTAILMFGSLGVDLGQWDEGVEDGYESGVCVEPGYSEGWMSARHYFSEDVQPTHWLPLSSPPHTCLTNEKAVCCG